MLYIFLLVLVGIIFHTWFTLLPISAGDWGFFFKEHIVEYLNPPFMWETFRNVGLGGNSFISQGVYFYNIPLGLLGRFLEYGIIERIIWFYPILLIGIIAPIILGKVLNIFPRKYFALIPFFYILNTYFFMIMGGGQLTVVLGYITIPLAFAVFMSSVKRITFFKVILFSFIFSLLFAFDFRLTYILIVIVFFYVVFHSMVFMSIKETIELGKKCIIIFISIVIVTAGIHAFWILPYSKYLYNPVASFTNAYTTTEAVIYFSFAQFENSLALLHPYWPENIFGKVGFMKQEFLILPILAFSSLLFINTKNKNLKEKLQGSDRIILFFAFLGLAGVFLAKGSNPPFGQVYLWLFTHMPGFIMFRDPTKWYTLVALSYSILIPFSIANLYGWLKQQKEFSIFNFQFSINKLKFFNIQNIFIVFIFGYLLFLIRPAIVGELGGTFKPVTVLQEYIDYKNFLLGQKEFFRVLWVPTMQRFTFYSNTHPAISGRDFFDNYNPYGAITYLQKESTKDVLRQSSVKYIVVPDDTQQEIFLRDRIYDETQYRKTIETLRKIPWLRNSHTFGKIVVFEIDNPKDHFWSTSEKTKTHSTFINPTEYKLSIRNSKKGSTIIFSEYFDRNWYMDDGSSKIYSKPYNNRFNSFVLEESGDLTVTILYKPQELVPFGLSITVVSFILTIGAMLVCFIKRW